MSKLKIWKSKHESWEYSPFAIGHVVSHGWCMKWKEDGEEKVGCSGNHIMYAETQFQYGYGNFRKHIKYRYKRCWSKLMTDLYGEDYA